MLQINLYFPIGANLVQIQEQLNSNDDFIYNVELDAVNNFLFVIFYGSNEFSKRDDAILESHGLLDWGIDVSDDDSLQDLAKAMNGW
jgi:hypothetical protein